MIGEALHTYFQIGDIGAVRVTGLEGCEYWDKVGGSVLKKQARRDRVFPARPIACISTPPPNA